MSFNDEGSVHNDPNGEILNCTWSLWAPGETAPRESKVARHGESVSFTLPPETQRLGNWTVMLVVKDNYGITATRPDPLGLQPLGVHPSPTSELLRPATEPYRKVWTLNVKQSAPPGFGIEWIVLIVILIAIIALAIFYIRRRSR